MNHRLLSRFGRALRSTIRLPRAGAEAAHSRQLRQVLRVKWTVPQDVQVCQNETTVVLLQIRKGLVYRADHVAARLWNSIAAGTDLEVVAAQIAHAEGVDCEVVRRDAEAFVTDLARRELICAAEPA